MKCKAETGNGNLGVGYCERNVVVVLIVLLLITLTSHSPLALVRSLSSHRLLLSTIILRQRRVVSG